jgi:GST-like protein
MDRYTLHGTPGWGSAIVEAQLDWLGLPYDYVTAGNVFASAEARQALARVNPLAQVPALVLPDGSLMTESAAITLHLADRTGRSDLVPRADEPTRAAFLRWLVFLVANVYPTFTYADDPSRFVADEAAGKAFRSQVDDYAKQLWRVVEQGCGTPWLLGERFSALDIYVGVMTRWRPRREWFGEHAPKLAAVARRADGLPALQAAWKRNFDA